MSDSNTSWTPPRFSKNFQKKLCRKLFRVKSECFACSLCRGDFACLVRRHYPIKNILFTFNENPENLFPLFTSEKFSLCVSIAVFFCVLNGCIIYVNLNNKVWITKQSPSWEKFGSSHETVQQNTSVTMPAAGGENCEVPKFL